MRMKENIDLIVYHGDCPDGWCAAYLASKVYPNAQLYPASHGGTIPGDEAHGKHVLVVDFSWKSATLNYLAMRAKSFTVLDHHVTAEAELIECKQSVGDMLDYVFDKTKSGAMITYEWLHPGHPAPMYVHYVQDRDLWNWQLPFTKEINAYLMALPQTVQAWDAIPEDAQQLVPLGRAIRLHISHYVDKVMAQAQSGMIDGLPCAVVNAAYPNISDVLGEIVRTHPEYDVAMGWFQRGDGIYQFSVASRPNSKTLVSNIARKRGGGGHNHAAGFQVSVAEGRQILDEVLQRP